MSSNARPIPALTRVALFPWTLAFTTTFFAGFLIWRFVLMQASFGWVDGVAAFFCAGGLLIAPFAARDNRRALRFARVGRFARGRVIAVTPIHGDSDDKERVTGAIWTYVVVDDPSDTKEYARGASDVVAVGHELELLIDRNGPADEQVVALDDLPLPLIRALKTHERISSTSTSTSTASAPSSGNPVGTPAMRARGGLRTQMHFADALRVVLGRKSGALALIAGMIGLITLGLITGHGSDVTAIAVVVAFGTAYWLTGVRAGVRALHLLRQGVFVDGEVVSNISTGVSINTRTQTEMRVRFSHERRVHEIVQRSGASLAPGTALLVVVDTEAPENSRALVRQDGDPHVDRSAGGLSWLGATAPLWALPHLAVVVAVASVFAALVWQRW